MNENLIVIFAKIYQDLEHPVRLWLENFGIDIAAFQEHEVVGIAFGLPPFQYLESETVRADILVIADRRINENDDRIRRILLAEFEGRKSIFILYHIGSDSDSEVRLGSQRDAIVRARYDSQRIFPAEKHSNNREIVTNIQGVGNALRDKNRSEYAAALSALQKEIGDSHRADLIEMLEDCSLPAGARRTQIMLQNNLLPEFIVNHRDTPVPLGGRKTTFSEALTFLADSTPTDPRYIETYEAICRLFGS